jgi:hypothetical protein
MRLRTLQITCWTAALTLAGQALALAETADFYRGKTVTLLVASGAGGGYDFFARALAKYVGRHIPGNPCPDQIRRTQDQLDRQSRKLDRHPVCLA